MNEGHTPLALPMGFFAAFYRPPGSMYTAGMTELERYLTRKSVVPNRVTAVAADGTRMELFLAPGCRPQEARDAGEFVCIFPSVEYPSRAGDSIAHGKLGESAAVESAGRFYTLRFGRKTGEFELSLDELTPLQVWYQRVGDTWVVSSDLRCFRRISYPQLNETALRLLLVYQSLPPGMSIFRGVRSVPALHSLKLAPDTEPELVPHPVRRFPELQNQTSIADCARAFTVEMDEALGQMLGSSMNYVCFSGGVGSAYVA